MKKLFAAVAVLTFAFSAQALDRTGEVAIGYQSSFAAAAAGATAINGNWSLKYGLSSNTNLQFLLGFGLTDVDNTAAYTFGARFLYDVVENENSDLYVGLGLGFTGGDGFGADADGQLDVNVPLGFAFSLANAPAVEFSAEMGLTWAYQLDAGTWQLGTNGGGAGAVFSAGAHYYF